MVYKCIEKECGHKFTGESSRTDGRRCPKCKGAIVPISEINDSVSQVVLKAYALKKSDFDNIKPSVEMQYESFIESNDIIDG